MLKKRKQPKEERGFHLVSQMNIDVEEALLIDTQANELLAELLDGEVEFLSEQDKLVLSENRKEIIRHLNTLFSKEIPLLLEGKEPLDATRLFWGLQLAGFLEASETFEWIEKLCHLSTRDLEDALSIAPEDLSYLLANTMDQWGVLKDTIENPDSDAFIRSACLQALVFSVAKNRVDRLEVIDYFKSLFIQIINGELDDDLFCTHLIVSCSRLWPGECLEEIRESFGLRLVRTAYIDIDYVLKQFSQGKDSCIERLQKQLQHHNFWEPLTELPPLSDSEQSRKFDRMLQLINQAEAKADQPLEETGKGSQRNAMCICGSGRKYKKCCMNTPSQEISSKILFEESAISGTPIELEPMKSLPEDVKESIWDLHPLIDENPEEVIGRALEYLSKYPNIPALYNFLYVAYHNTGQLREAMRLMKKTVQLFPDYLFGRVAYAHYLLRRAEPEKAHAALGNAATLSQLYPERKVFHTSEWIAFSCAMSLYWIEKDDVSQAKIYLTLIQKIDPNSCEVTDLKQKIKRKLFLQALQEVKKEKA